MITYTDEFGNIWELAITINHYRNNDNLYLGLVVAEDCYDDEGNIDTYRGEPYADLSVNIEPLPEDCIAVNIEYSNAGLDIIEENNLGAFTGYYISSGYMQFPMYMMDMTEVKKHVV